MDVVVLCTLLLNIFQKEKLIHLISHVRLHSIHFLTLTAKIVCDAKLSQPAFKELVQVKEKCVNRY